MANKAVRSDGFIKAVKDETVWYCYHITPIDIGWNALPTIPEYIKLIYAECSELELDTEKVFLDYILYGKVSTGHADVNEILEGFQFGKQVARKLGWEGDFRDAPVVFLIPSDVYFLHGFAWKQDNSGSTFIISPIEMPWLTKHLVTY